MWNENTYFSLAYLLWVWHITSPCFVKTVKTFYKKLLFLSRGCNGTLQQMIKIGVSYLGGNGNFSWMKKKSCFKRCFQFEFIFVSSHSHFVLINFLFSKVLSLFYGWGRNWTTANFKDILKCSFIPKLRIYNYLIIKVDHALRNQGYRNDVPLELTYLWFSDLSWNDKTNTCEEMSYECCPSQLLISTLIIVYTMDAGSWDMTDEISALRYLSNCSDIFRAGICL